MRLPGPVAAALRPVQARLHAAGQLGDLVRSSGVYGLASVAPRLIALALTPFLAHHLAPGEYGLLALLSAAIGLATGVTQLGLGAALLRGYNYQYVSAAGRRDVLASVVALIAATSVPLTAAAVLLAPAVAGPLLGRPAAGGLLALTAVAVLASNLTVPGFGWLRAENRAGRYSLLALAQSLTVLAATVLLVGGRQLGVAGALAAVAMGDAVVVCCTLPVLLARAGVRLRPDVVRSLLAFGVPLIASGVATWVLQLSDRYLLGILRSLAETGVYTVGYTLGSALPVAVIAPFNLAWSSIQYSIARRPDATQQFTRVFRWFGPGLVLSGFGLAMAGQVVLGWLFPPAYGAARPVIPIVAAGWVFYGAYAMFATGVNVAGRSWLLAVYTTVAAAVNVVVNLLLIPPLGAVGAALATLIAYGALAAMAYAGTRLVHRIPFEVGRFLLAVLVGAAVYAGSDALAGPAGALWAWPLRVGALLACGGLLVGLGRRAGRAPSTTRRPAAVRAWWPARRPPS